MRFVDAEVGRDGAVETLLGEDVGLFGFLGDCGCCYLSVIDMVSFVAPGSGYAMPTRSRVIYCRVMMYLRCTLNALLVAIAMGVASFKACCWPATACLSVSARLIGPPGGMHTSP